MSAPTRTRSDVRTTTTGPWLYDAVVGHARRAPTTHGFSYRVRPWLVDLDTLDADGRPRALPRLLAGQVRFTGADHFDGVEATLRGAVDAWCSRHHRPRPARVLTLTQPRTLGHVFNPISVHWLLDADGDVDLVLAEVHNTYAGRHVYEVHRDDAGRAQVDKAFPVSPFFTTAGHYEMAISDPGERVDVSITLALPAAATDPTTDAPEPAADPARDSRPFTATLRGHRVPATTGAVLATLARHTWPTVRTSALIRRHGIALWWRGRRGSLPVQPHPQRSTWEGVR
ncbi:DUF1365 domain-containing protein [Rhodococcus aerolatus]